MLLHYDIQHVRRLRHRNLLTKAYKLIETHAALSLTDSTRLSALPLLTKPWLTGGILMLVKVLV